MDEDRRASQHIRVGPAGWSYQDWAGQVYPKPRPRGFNPLRYLAEYFAAIEINATFYRIPDPETTHRWVARVADHPDFRFTAKLCQGFTHEATANAQDAAAFRQAMAPLHFRGQAALNALELRHHLRRAPVPVPPPLLAAYPELRQIAAPASEADT